MNAFKATHKLLIAVLTAVGMTMVFAGSAAGQYPERTIRIVVPWKAGGGTDSIARGFQAAFEEAAGVSVVIDNVSGARGVTGTLKVVNARPDGYTLLLNGSTDITAAMTFKQLPFTLDDLSYIGGFYTSPTYVISHEDREIETLKEFLELAKQNPGEVKLGTAGSTQLLMANAIKGITGLDFRIVPFSGGADLKKAMIGNEVHAGIFHAPVMLSEIKGGLINVIGTGKPLEKLTYEPARDTETLRDNDIPLDFAITRGLYAPKGTPDAVIGKLRAITKEAAMSAKFAEWGKSFGFAPVWVPGDEFRAQLKSDLKNFKQIKADYID